MGMYDYLGGEQVKIFYRPIFQLNKEDPKNSSFWFSGGSLENYDRDDDLPLKTLYYKYPPNFLVYDYRFDYEDVWLIRNEKFDCIMPYTELTEKDLIGPVFDYYGNPINIQTVSDFAQIKEDFYKRLEEIEKVEKELFPKGIVNTFFDNSEEYEKRKAEWDKRLQEIDERYVRKWEVKDPYEEEKHFGALIDCYIFARLNKDAAPIRDIIDPKKDYIGCKLTIREFITQHPGIIERYKKWLDDEEMLREIDFDKLIEEIMQRDPEEQTILI